eukprot:UN05289
MLKVSTQIPVKIFCGFKNNIQSIWGVSGFARHVEVEVIGCVGKKYAMKTELISSPRISPIWKF